MEKKSEGWKFRAHLSGSKRTSIRMEVKEYKGVEMFREEGNGKPIYYIQSDKKNYPSEEKLKEAIDKTKTP